MMICPWQCPKWWPGVGSIGGKDGGASDAIIHNKTGLICDGNNLDEIYSSINELINNNKFLEFGKNAKEHSNIFLWDKVINSYKKILQWNWNIT